MAQQGAVFHDQRVLLRYRSSGQLEAAERTVDPYGLVSKSGIWYLVADTDGEPRLFRVARVAAATETGEPVRRRDGMTLAGLWEELRRQVDERPLPVGVQARVRRARLDMFGRIFAAHLTGPDAADGDGSGDGDGEWAVVTLRFAAVRAARTLLSFGDDVVVTAPAAVREDLRATAAAVAGCYAAAAPSQPIDLAPSSDSRMMSACPAC